MNTKINKSLLKGICAGAALMASTTVFAEELYTVDGNMVDDKTWLGFKIYNRAGCSGCHGPTGEGGAAFPSLIEGLKKISKDDFMKVVKEGRKTMPPMDQAVTSLKIVKKKAKSEDEAYDGLYAYVKGRSEGDIPPGKLKKIK